MAQAFGLPTAGLDDPGAVAALQRHAELGVWRVPSFYVSPEGHGSVRRGAERAVVRPMFWWGGGGRSAGFGGTPRSICILVRHLLGVVMTGDGAGDGARGTRLRTECGGRLWPQSCCWS